MAPSVISPVQTLSEDQITLKKQLLVQSSQYKEVEPYGASRKNPRLLDAELKGSEEIGPASYPHFLPVFEHDGEYPPLEEFEHHDIGHDADPSFPNLLGEGTEVNYLTPKFGADVTGVQISSLDNNGLAELSRFVAERGVVAFRDQDLADQTPDFLLKLASTFGPNHIHPSSGAPKGYPEIHLVHRAGGEAGRKSAERFLESRTSSVAWHSDVTYELQPPSTTMLVLLDAPQDKNGNIAGGDTLFTDQRQAYSRLSKEFRKRLRGLTASHSGFEQAEHSRLNGGVVRREPVINVHPVVREHPVTKEKALFVNEQFTRQIIGFKKEESDYLLNFLYGHQAKGADFQARVKWAPKTVVVWDNRIALHTAILDYTEGQRRHLLRLTPQAERPYEGEYTDEE